ncbi:MAG: hypothetical protein KJ954_14415, partial [Alphaproteobacteria bacterium]|nr:hypothetical protein [Alphaproteobacteria bacterium]
GVTMPSKDTEKNRQSAKRRMSKFRDREKGVTKKVVGVTDIDTTKPLAILTNGGTPLEKTRIVLPPDVMAEIDKICQSRIDAGLYDDREGRIERAKDYFND